MYGGVGLHRGRIFIWLFYAITSHILIGIFDAVWIRTHACTIRDYVELLTAVHEDFDVTLLISQRRSTHLHRIRLVIGGRHNRVAILRRRQRLHVFLKKS